jgi:hypothetical protein
MALEAIQKNAIGRETGRNTIPDGTLISTIGNKVRTQGYGSFNALTVEGNTAVLDHRITTRDALRATRGKGVPNSSPVELTGQRLNDARVSIRRGPFGIAGRTQIRHKP